MLIELAMEAMEGIGNEKNEENEKRADWRKAGGYPPGLGEVAGRYRDIIDNLGLNDNTAANVESDLRARLDAYVEQGLSGSAFLDLMKAAGEDNCAKIVAAYFRSEGIPASYVDPKEAGFVLSDDFGNAQALPETYANAARALCGRLAGEVIVFPGFYGYTKSGNVITFSRGGSDITGSILAAALDASLYENFTDVSHVYSVNPGLVDSPEPIMELTYREMRELSYAGFNVYHEDALIPVFSKGIPVRIKNTNDPAAVGTAILPTRKTDSARPVSGISADDGFMSVNISKLLMNSEIGFGRKVLAIIEDERISFEHMPSGIDNISVILRESSVSPEAEARIERRLRDELGVDDVTVRHGLSIVMLVGEGMLNTIGTTARASNALALANINIELINQGASEVSMMFGVAQKDASEAVRSLYREFFEAK
jgi:aspartate kinase